MADVAKQAGRGKRKLSRTSSRNIKIVAVVTGVVAIECALAYMFFPNADEARRLAELRLARLGEAKGELTQTSLHAAEDAVEIDLGEFSLTGYDPSAEIASFIDFHLHLVVRAEDEAQAKLLLERADARVKNTVETIARASNPTEFQDPNLGVLKRKIQTKLNQLLGGKLVQEVVVVGFRYYQQ